MWYIVVWRNHSIVLYSGCGVCLDSQEAYSACFHTTCVLCTPFCTRHARFAHTTRALRTHHTRALCTRHTHALRTHHTRVLRPHHTRFAHATLAHFARASFAHATRTRFARMFCVYNTLTFVNSAPLVPPTATTTELKKQVV